jgi:hypothetical protein
MLAHWIFVHEQINVVRPRLISLFELVIQDLRVVYTVPTLKGSHPDYFIDNIHALFRDRRLLILLDQKVRARLKLKYRNSRLGRDSLSFPLVILYLPLGFHHSEIVLINNVMLSAQAVSGIREV